MGVSKVMAIKLNYSRLALTPFVRDPVVLEIFYFKHDVGSLIIFFIGNLDVDNIGDAIFALSYGNEAIRLSHRSLLTFV